MTILAATLAAASIFDATACINSSLDGLSESIGVFDVTQSGQSLTVQSHPRTA